MKDVLFQRVDNDLEKRENLTSAERFVKTNIPLRGCSGGKQLGGGYRLLRAAAAKEYKPEADRTRCGFFDLDLLMLFKIDNE